MLHVGFAGHNFTGTAPLLADCTNAGFAYNATVTANSDLYYTQGQDSLRSCTQE